MTHNNINIYYINNISNTINSNINDDNVKENCTSMKQFHDMPHVMHLFLSPGEGGEFVGWQGRQCAPSPSHTHTHTLLCLLCLSLTRWSNTMQLILLYYKEIKDVMRICKVSVLDYHNVRSVLISFFHLICLWTTMDLIRCNKVTAIT